MPFFKDERNAVHFLSADDIAGGGLELMAELSGPCEEITEEEARAILNPPLTLDQAKDQRLQLMQAAYLAAIQTAVSFTSSAGVTKSFQADNDGENSSQAVLLKAMQGYSLAGAVPEGFYWIAEDNDKVPFTLGDLQGLYGAMLAQGWAAFQTLQDKKTEIRAAETVADVETISW